MEELIILAREIRAVTAAVKEMSAAISASESAAESRPDETRESGSTMTGGVTATSLSLALKAVTGRTS